MSGVHNSVETVNAAATAIVSAESRVQPVTVQASKRRWGSCWNLYWCFGPYKHSKRIGHAVLISAEPSAPAVVPLTPDTRNLPSAIVLPFIAPPSSPASFLLSDPSSAPHSRASGLLSLASLSAADGGSPAAPIFTIGPYAHETQPVSPPVFSTFTTEPSTACFTPPPEAVHMTTPSSPDVPFAELLSSSLARSNRRNSASSFKYSLSQYEFQPYPTSISGTSSPFPDKRYEYFPGYKWGSRIGSGSLTPNGCSRLGSGTLTPNGAISRLGSGTVTPSGGISRLGSGTLTPSGDGKNQTGSEAMATIINPMDDNRRVSFELLGEDIPICIMTETDAIPLSKEMSPGDPQEAEMVINPGNDDSLRSSEDGARKEQNLPEVSRMRSDEVENDERLEKNRTTSLGSNKDFNFNNTKQEAVKEETGPPNTWSFFPMLGSSGAG